MKRLKKLANDDDLLFNKLLDEIDDNTEEFKKFYKFFILRFFVHNKDELINTSPNEYNELFHRYYTSNINVENAMRKHKLFEDFVKLPQPFQHTLCMYIIHYMNNDIYKNTNSYFLQILMPLINRVQDNRRNESERLQNILNSLNHTHKIYITLIQSVIEQFYNDYKDNLPNKHLLIINKFKQYCTSAEGELSILHAFNNNMSLIAEQPFHIQNTIIKSDIFNTIIKLINTDAQLSHRLKVLQSRNCIDVLILPHKNRIRSTSDCTALGKQVIKQIYTICKEHFDQASMHEKFEFRLHPEPNKFPHYEHIVSMIIPIIQAQYNPEWTASSLDRFIRRYAIYIIIPRIIQDFKKSIDLDAIRTKIFNVIKKHLPEIIPKITDQFLRGKNGYYEYSWLTEDAGQRWEADPVLKYIKTNRYYTNMCLKEALNINLQQFNTTIMPWDQFITSLLNCPQILDDFHLQVRKYLVKMNQDIVLQKSEKIVSEDDTDRIVFINNRGRLMNKKNHKHIRSRDGIQLDFDPRNDSQREKPIVIIREYIHNDNEPIDENNYKDHIIAGRRGADHASILNAKKYQPLLERSKNTNDSYTIACCYLIGHIVVIDNLRFSFPSINEIKDALVKSGKFKKIYIYPEHDQIIYRLAKKYGLFTQQINKNRWNMAY